MTETNNTAKTKKFAFSTLIACCFLQFCSNGLILATGGTYLSFVAEAFSTKVSTVALYITICSISTMLFNPIVSRLMNKGNARMVTILAMACQILAYMSNSLWNQVWGWYISGALLGVGSACLTYLVVPFFVNSWFKEKVGSYIGIAVIWPGVAQMIFQPITSMLCTNYGYKASYLIIGGIASVLGIIPALFLLKNPPKTYGMEAYGADKIDPAAQQRMMASMKGMEPKNVYRHKLFVPAVIMTLCFGYTVSTTSLVSTFARLSGVITSSSAGFASTFFAAGMIVGKFFSGKMYDKLTLRTTVVTWSLVQCIGYVGFILVYTIQSPILLFASCAICGCGVGATGTVTTPMVARQTFGSKSYSGYYPKFALIISAAQAVDAFVNNWIYDMTGKYALVWIIMASMSVVAMIAISVIQGGLEEAKKDWV